MSCSPLNVLMKNGDVSNVLAMISMVRVMVGGVRRWIREVRREGEPVKICS